MKPPPHDWPRLSAAVFYADPSAAIEWLVRAFDFQVRIRVDGPDGAVLHSELVYGEGVIMVGGESRERHRLSPRTLGGAMTAGFFLYVDDVEAHCRRAEQAGAKIITPVRVSDYGEAYWADKGYEAEDPEGHRWWFAERARG